MSKHVQSLSIQSNPKADYDVERQAASGSVSPPVDAPFRPPSDAYEQERYSYYPKETDPKYDPASASLINHSANKPIDEQLYQDSGRVNEFEYGEHPSKEERPTLMNRILPTTEAASHIQQQISRKRDGVGMQKYPFVTWAVALACIGVFIYELVVNSNAQGTPVSFKPVVNPMLGPSSSALIQLGARFPPCMKAVPLVPVTLPLPCLNDTANPPDRVCPLADICGFGGIPIDPATNQYAIPNQWFRFIVPIFLHAGFIHIILNMLALLVVSAQIEREMGSGGFTITFFAAGIFGNVLGGNFALVGVPSVGASGAIFGTIAIAWVDLVAHWKYKYRPVRMLIFMIIEFLVGFGIGYIPGIDNFAHLGGFAISLLVGTFFYPIISTNRKHKIITWSFRLVALPIAIVLFYLLIRNFYTEDPAAQCPGCRFLSCFPTDANNHCQGTGLTTVRVNN